MTVEPGAGIWKVTAAGIAEPVLSGPLDCDGDTPPLRAAEGEPFVQNEFGSFIIELESNRTRRLMRWTSPTCAPPSVTTDPDGAVNLTWQAGDTAGRVTPDREPQKAPITLRIAPYFRADETPNPTRFDLLVTLASDDPNIIGGELRFNCNPDDAFFGLGTQVTGLDLRGRKYPLWTQEQGNGKKDNPLFPLEGPLEAAYAPMGVWHSSANYSAIIGHDGYTEIDFCSQANKDHTVVRSYGAPPSFVIVRGDTPRARMNRIADYVGRPPTVPDWVFAPWNDAVGGPPRMDEVATRLRDNNIPSSAIWSEDWMGGSQSATGFRLSYIWQWDPVRYPDLPGLINNLHKNGFAFLGYFNPFVPEPGINGNEKSPVWLEGIENGYLHTDKDGNLVTLTDPAFRNASQVDLTNDDAIAWLKGYLEEAAVTQNHDGWMVDFAEWMQITVAPKNGESAWLEHNRYPLRWQKVNTEVLAAANETTPEGYTYFARSGWASINGGTPGVIPTLWAGDQETDWGYGDGFPTVIPIGLHAGLSGISIYGSDIAGYTSISVPNTNKELFYRWAAQGAFTPLMRTHHGSDECGNWSFDRDPETLLHYARYARIHTLMLPIWQALHAESRAKGLPIMRHPFIVEPQPTAPLWKGTDYQYFLGDNVLVAPVLEEGATTRTVTLPLTARSQTGETVTSTWWPLFGDAPLAATAAATADADTFDTNAAPTELPVFVRAGTALPPLHRAPDTFYPLATEAGVTTLDDVKGEYRIALYPTADGDAETSLNAGPVATGDSNPFPTLTAIGLDFSATAPFANPRRDNDGTAIPECDDTVTLDVPLPDASCVDPDGRFIVLVEESVAVTFGEGDSGGTLGVESNPTAKLWIAIGKDAWGELANPTTLTDLDPNIPPPCEE